MSLRSNKELAYGAATVVAASYVLDSPRVRTYLAPLLAALPVTAAAALAELRRRDPARPSVLEDVTAALARSGWVGDAVGLVLIHALSRHVLLAMRTTLKERKTAATDFAFGLAQRLPAVRRRLEAEMDKFEEETRAELGKRDRAAAAAVRLPVRGVSTASILSGMTAAAATENVKWTDGKVSGAVYSGEPNHLHFLNQVQALHAVANPLHPDMWPSVSRYDGEIASMTARLVDGGDAGVCGAVTSGGSDSILIAVKAHRQYHRKTRGVTNPEIVAAVTAHPALEKACEALSIRLVRIPCDDETGKPDPAAMVRGMTCDTIMLYASAPEYARGMIDPIAELSAACHARGVGLHVDMCLGGFVLPFVKKAGGPRAANLPEFDFSLPGVTSMSLDTHKYGYAAKGTSVVLYRNAELRKAAYFSFPDWPGGLYTTSGLAGSRNGAVVAACWASLMSLGEEGLSSRALSIVDTTREIAEGVRLIPELDVCGDPQAMIVAFKSKKGSGVNVYSVADAMSKRGWALNCLTDPPSVHLCVTVRHLGKADLFIQDLAASAAEARALADAGDQGTKSAVIYGMASSLPAGPIRTLLDSYTTVVLSA